MTLPAIILPGIERTLEQFAILLSESATYQAIVLSLGTFSSGFVLAALCGTVLGLASGISRDARAIFAPVLALCSTVPAVAWMGLALAWFGLDIGPTIFLIVVSTASILAFALQRAVQHRDQNLEDLVRVFEVPRNIRLRHVILPPLFSSAHGALVAMAGLSWKLTVMGEFLIASDGLGGLMTEAKSHLQTDRLLAITALLVLIYALIALGVAGVASPRLHAWVRVAGKPTPKSHYRPSDAGLSENAVDESPLLKLSNVSIEHDGVLILRDLTFEVAPRSVTAILGKSGVGKSSVLQVISGIAAPSNGIIHRTDELRTSYVFQEDRLLPWRSLEQNVSLISGASAKRTADQL